MNTGFDPHRLSATMRKLERTNFGAFVQGAFRVLHDEPFLRNWHIDAIAHHLTELAYGDIRRLIITMPPRSMKSFIASVCLPAWLLGRKPSNKIICASYSQELSREFAYQMRKLMQSSWYKSVFPRTHLDPKKMGLDEIGTTRGGYRLTTSTGGTLTGRGGNFIIIDDPLKAKDGQSQVAREAAINWFRNTVLSRLNNPRAGRIVVVAQRLHMEDLVGHLIAQGGWQELCLPLIADKDQEIPLSANAVAERLAGNILHEARFGPEDIAELRAAMGEQHFEAQYNQRPLPPGGALFKLAWLKRYDNLPQPYQAQAIIQSWDTGYEVEDDHDFSVCTTWAIVGKHCYLLDVYRARLKFYELEKAVYAKRAEWKADLVIVEKSGAGRSLYQNIRGQAGHRWIEVKTPEGSKEDRASQQSPKFERGEIWVPKEAPWLKGFEDELASFPHSKHDDQVDSVTQFLASVDTGQLLRRADQARRW